MKPLAMGLTNEDIWLTLYVILVFVVFISGMFLGALISPRRRHNAAREAWHSRPAPAEAKPRRDRKAGSTKLLAVVTALIVVFGVIVLDHFKGPFLPEEFYCLSNSGSQVTGKCTGRHGSPLDRASGAALAE
jgi:hypothetical protein